MAVSRVGFRFGRVYRTAGECFLGRGARHEQSVRDRHVIETQISDADVYAIKAHMPQYDLVVRPCVAVPRKLNVYASLLFRHVSGQKTVKARAETYARQFWLDAGVRQPQVPSVN